MSSSPVSNAWAKIEWPLPPRSSTGSLLPDEIRMRVRRWASVSSARSRSASAILGALLAAAA